MKIYKLNSLTTLLITILMIGLVALFPIMLIEALWNTTVAKTYTEFSIDFWQASILWLILLVTLNILGIFKFEFAIEKFEDHLDKNNLKKKIEDLHIKTETKLESEQTAMKTEIKEKD